MTGRLRAGIRKGVFMRRSCRLRAPAFVLLLASWCAAAAQPGGCLPELAHGLNIAPPGGVPAQNLGIGAALQALHIPSVSVALVEHDTIAAAAFGDASAQTIYQAASMSKLVTAVAALRLVDQGRLHLDRDVNDDLRSWHLPASPLTRGHPVTLRLLLSMAGGIGVPGYLGYAPDAQLPNLTQILEGSPPANSPPVRVERVPGSAYAYSGGGFEIVQALIEDATGLPFAAAMQNLVLGPLGMSHSGFVQPPRAMPGPVAAGHYASGVALPGGWRVMPELAAGGLWSTPTDLAKLLVAVARASRGPTDGLPSAAISQAMLTRQSGGYGLGAALGGSAGSLAMMKRGQNVGYQGYMLVFPATGQGMAIMTGSDNGTTLATALLRRAATACHWPPLGPLLD